MINFDTLWKKCLDLAIKGQLVPQDPNDAPASELLKEIKAEKEQLIKAKKLKKDKNESFIFRGKDGLFYETIGTETKCIQDEIPFEIPKSWEWCRLGFIGNWASGCTPKRNNKNYYGNDIPWLKTGDLTDGYIDVIPESITKMALNECSLRLNPVGSILVAMYGATVGKLGILKFPATTNQACCACLPIIINNLYLFYFLYSHKSEFIKAGTGGAQPNISKEKIVATLLPLPPLAEQKRIVAKLEEIRTNVDAGKLAYKQITKDITPSIKKKVLDLAIKGQLVPQDPKDAPASELLKEIKAEKEQLIKAKKIKKDKNESFIFRGKDGLFYETIGTETKCIQDEIPFEIPSSWELFRLSSLCTLIDGIRGTGEYINIDAKFLRKKADGKIIKSGKYIEKDDYVILVDGENSGEVFQVPCNGYMGSTFKKLYVNSQLYIPYVIHYISCHKYLLSHSKKGATIPHLNKEIFYGLLIGIPPLAEQKRIVAKLEQLFSNFECL